MNYRGMSIITIVCLLVANSCLAETKGVHADLYFNTASAIFSNDYTLDIDFETVNNEDDLGVYSCWLQERVNSVWITQYSITRPLYEAHNTCSYVTTMDYSGSLNLTGIFRIKVVIYGGEHSKTIYSNVCTF